MENTFMLDFGNTVGGFMTGIAESTDLFTAAVIIMVVAVLLIAVTGRRKNPAAA